MSHVSKIELEVNDLDTLKAACKRLGLEFIDGQKTYAWYGRFMRDYPLPDGISADDLGKCDHAIRVPGAEYEIGIVKKNGKYTLLWDFWQSGGLEKKLGKNAGKLKQAYAVERVRREARTRGYGVCEQKVSQEIRLVLTM
jgi:hypothetical protein